MPIAYQEGWNKLNLAKLKDADNVALFWKAKARMKAAGPERIKDLDALAAKEKPTSAERKLIKNIPTEKAAIENALRREKVTSAMVKKFANLNTLVGPGNLAPQRPAFGVTVAKNLDPVMEQIHNDRLRISDCEMLKKYSAAAITIALFGAKPRFTANARVAALLVRSTSMQGEAVTVTQGVHQSDDPHFDVLMPGEPQQYHVNVSLAPKFEVVSISYMNGATKKEGTTLVKPDAVVAPPVVTI